MLMFSNLVTFEPRTSCSYFSRAGPVKFPVRITFSCAGVSPIACPTTELPRFCGSLYMSTRALALPRPCWYSFLSLIHI